MPYILRTISQRQFRVLEFIRNYHDGCKGWPTLQDVCVYFHSNPTRALVTLRILERHHFLEEVGGRFQVIERHPLLLPFGGGVG